MSCGGAVEWVTTAAGIWMTSAIGMVAGMGMEIVALMTTLVALMVLGVIPKMTGSAPPPES
ncbi:MAG: MgtC/SapB family protein [Thermomonas sp.]